MNGSVVSDYGRRHSFSLHSTTCGTDNATVQCRPASIAAVWDSALFNLLMEEGAAEDYASAPNGIASMMTSETSLAESSPQCGSCSSGFYISAPCAQTEDRVCAECSHAMMAIKRKHVLRQRTRIAGVFPLYVRKVHLYGLWCN